MTVTVRPSTDPAEVDALDADNPWAWATAWWRQLDTGWDEPVSRWWVAEADGEPVGWSAVVPLGLAAAGCGVGLLWVLPEHRRRGVGTALRRPVEEAVAGAGLPGVQYAHETDDPDAVAAVAAWSLTEVARHQESVLDLAGIDALDFRRRSERPGVDLALLPDPATYDDAQWERLHAFVAARFAEAPDADGAEAMPREMLQGILTEGPLGAVASEAGRWVGFTAVLRRAGTTDVVNTFLTGVVPEARGRGIASALKCFHALALRERGVARIITQNMDGNVPILAANRSLGFVPHREYADVVARVAP